VKGSVGRYGGRVLAVECRVLGTSIGRGVWGVKCQVLGVRCRVSGVGCRMLGVVCWVLGVRCCAWGVGRWVLGVKCGMLCVGCGVLGVGADLSRGEVGLDVVVRHGQEGGDGYEEPPFHAHVRVRWQRAVQEVPTRA
jgi:hypothetical protein